jgi:hypothetical protein
VLSRRTRLQLGLWPHTSLGLGLGSVPGPVLGLGMCTAYCGHQQAERGVPRIVRARRLRTQRRICRQRSGEAEDGCRLNHRRTDLMGGDEGCAKSEISRLRRSRPCRSGGGGDGLTGVAERAVVNKGLHDVRLVRCNWRCDTRCNARRSHIVDCIYGRLTCMSKSPRHRGTGSSRMVSSSSLSRSL